jgi:hypothetical protein
MRGMEQNPYESPGQMAVTPRRWRSFGYWLALAFTVVVALIVLDYAAVILNMFIPLYRTPLH